VVDDDLLRRAVDATPDALCAFGLDGVVVWANQSFADLVGHPLEALPGMEGHQFADTDGRRQFDDHVAEMVAGHPGAQNEEVLVRRSDGRDLWCLGTWWPVHDDEGVIVAYLHRFTEYTQRRHFLDRLRESESELQRAQRIAVLGSWRWDVAAGDVWWSDNLYAIHGVDRRTFRPSWDSFIDLLHPDDRDEVTTTILEALSTRDRYAYETRVRAGGGLRTLRGIGEIERDDDGVAQIVTGTVQDVSELRAANDAAAKAVENLVMMQQLAEAANRSSTLADALVRSAQLLAEQGDWHPICVFVRTERGAPLTTLELPQPAAPGLPDPDFEVAEKVWRSRETMSTPLLDRDDVLVTIPVVGGRSMACVIQAVGPRESAERTQWPLVLQVGDQLSRVAERERTTQQLAEARDEAMAASQHKSEFLATMSHEIRTPMNGVIGLTDLLLRSDLDDQQRRLAESLRGAGLTLLALINDILDLSKIESGKLELEAIEFEVRTVVDDTVAMLEGPARDKGLDLVVAVDPDVPRLVRGDPVRLGQVLTNLGSNAVKFTDAGEVAFEVRVEPDPAAEGDADDVTLRVEVRDTGIGISETEVDGLFDAFTQADRSTTRQHGGTGLGLAISRQLAEGMGGEIGVRSAPGAGSAFWFTCRLGTVAPGTDLTHLDRPLERRRVLVVASDVGTASYLVRQLTAWQLRVDRAADVAGAASALTEAAADQAPYDVALVALDQVAALALARDPATVRAGVDLVLVGGRVTGPHGDVRLRSAGYRVGVPDPVGASDLYRALIDPSGAGGAVEETTAGSGRADRPDLGLHVLVVEDNAVNQLVAAGLLENMGCTVVAVDNGVEAVQALAGDHPYDVVLMDCRMPRMDGFDATRAIRAAERGPRVPIIAMTASALPGERERCLDAGMDDFLTKPVDPDQLEAAITRAGAGARGAEAATPARTSQRGTGGAEGVLDRERVELLSELVKDGVSFFERTRMSFLSRIDGTLAQISIAVQDGDAERVAADAHQLKGSALNLGLLRVGAAAEAMEELGRTGTLEDADDLLRALRDAVAEGVEALAAEGRA
jgi:two-component system sensor histidine kinase/response regulator